MCLCERGGGRGKKGDRHEEGLSQGMLFEFYGMKWDLIRGNSNNIFRYFHVTDNEEDN